MRILLVTREDPYTALTGVATYVRDLAGALTARGREVAHLYVEPRGRRACARLTWTNHGGTAVGVIATPGVRPESDAARLRADVAAPDIERAVDEAIRTLRPDIVHIHDLSGVPVSVVSAARASAVPVVVTFHDFWPFCRQFLLVRPGLVPCSGSDGGRNCARYCAQPAPATRRFARWADATLPAGLRDGVRWAQRLYRRRRGGSGSQFVVGDRAAGDGVADPRLAGAYAARETGMREVLLDADCLLTVSEFAKAVYVRHGYPQERIRVLPLALQAAGQVQRRARAFERYPVRFGYLGRVTPWKGAHLLAEAARGVPAASAQFTFYGAVEDEDRAHLTALSGGHPGLRFAGRYSRSELGRILDEIDVAVFPSIMTETLGLVGLEAQAAGIPIIGAAHGAITEYVRDGQTGLLFSPGDVEALRAGILRVVEHPDLIARLSAAIAAPRRMDEHVDAVELAYAGVLGAGRPAGEIDRSVEPAQLAGALRGPAAIREEHGT
ncbi:MAG TPA: glycosyltransferase [bacterium]|nr:glycosyltransferase [bacterium]